MPGVAQPNYDQSGGSNNPTRAMAITVNGQPPNNTVVRLDGVSQINQFFQQIQAYSPEPRSHRDGQRRHQQLRRRSGDGRRRVGERAGEERHEHARRIAVRTRDRLPDEGEELLPAGRRPEGHRQHARLRRHGRRAHLSATRCSSSPASSGRASAPTPATPCRTPAPTACAACRRWRCATGNFAGTGTVLYDPRTGAANGTGRVPFAFANCPGLSVD